MECHRRLRILSLSELEEDEISFIFILDSDRHAMGIHLPGMHVISVSKAGVV